MLAADVPPVFSGLQATLPQCSLRPACRAEPGYCELRESAHIEHNDASVDLRTAGHWALFVLAATYPVTEDPFGPECGSLMANEVACDPLLSIVAAVLGVIAMLGILTWSNRWQTRQRAR